MLLIGCSTVDEIEADTHQIEKMNKSDSGKIPVNFSYQPLIGGKHEVFLSGDFNNWSKTELLMKEVNGIYEITLYLKRGKYAYKFIVDGQWLADESADEFIGDGFGGQNSVIFVGDNKDINSLRKVEFFHHPTNNVKDVYVAVKYLLFK